MGLHGNQSRVERSRRLQARRTKIGADFEAHEVAAFDRFLRALPGLSRGAGWSALFRFLCESKLDESRIEYESREDNMGFRRFAGTPELLDKLKGLFETSQEVCEESLEEPYMLEARDIVRFGGDTSNLCFVHGVAAQAQGIAGLSHKTQTTLQIR